MNICLVHEEFPEETNFGGIATYQRNLAVGLSKLGHKVYVITRSYKEEKTYVENEIIVHRIYQEESENKLEDYKNYRMKVYKKLKELEPFIDIIESPEWSAEVIYYLRDVKRKKPVVIKLHTPLKIWLEHNNCDLGPEITNKMLSWEKEVIEKADAVISCTKILKNLVEQKMGIKRTDIQVVPNPANLESFYIKGDSPKKYILFCGSLEMRKGVHILGKAIPIVLSVMPEAEWVFVGKDTNRNDKGISMIQYIYDIVPKEYHKNIKFLGQIPNKDLVDIYAAAIIAVFPSSFDNFPYVVLEAMACGIPIVGSRFSGMTEMLENGISGSLCDSTREEDLAKEILKLLKDEKLRNSYAIEAFKRVHEKYSSITVAEQNLFIYENTINVFEQNS